MRILLSVGIIAYCATSLNGGCVNSKCNSVEPFDRAKGDFASQFFKAVVEDQSQNTICSPLSAKLMLSIMKHGASGNTQRELELVLPNSNAGSGDRTMKFFNDINNYGKIELYIATNIFVADGQSPKLNFKELIAREFKSSIENIDFGNATTASNRINEWSAARTNNRIPQIITTSNIHPNLKVVLVNAIYFRGAWAKPFDPAMTKPCPFYVNGKTIKQVPTMHKLGVHSHGKLRKFKAKFFKMLYKSPDFDHDLHMYVIIPDDVDGFIKLRTKLDKITIDMLRNKEADYTNIAIKMPKFKIDTLLDLSGPLDRLGLNDMFSDTANFTGMLDSDDVKVDNIFQKAVLEVDEKGTEAAVVTFRTDVKHGLHTRKALPQYVVDRPFFIKITTQTGVILLSALIVDPIGE